METVDRIFMIPLLLTTYNSSHPNRGQHFFFPAASDFSLLIWFFFAFLPLCFVLWAWGGQVSALNILFFRNQFLTKHIFQQQEISEEKAKKRRRKRGVVRGWEKTGDMDFIRAPCVSVPPPGERALFCALPPAQSSCHGQDLLERQPPVEAAGQGLSKDKGAFWCADRRTGQMPRCVRQSKKGECDDV